MGRLGHCLTSHDVLGDEGVGGRAMKLTYLVIVERSGDNPLSLEDP